MELSKSMEVSFKKKIVATIIASFVFVVLFFAVSRGYVRGFDNYGYVAGGTAEIIKWQNLTNGYTGSSSSMVRGFILVKSLLYLFTFFSFVFALFLRWFILADIKNKLMRSFFIFPFMFTLLFYIYFNIFEGGMLVSSGGFGQGAIVVFFVEVVAMFFYLSFLIFFVKKLNKSVNRIDKIFMGLLIFHPILLFLIGTMVSRPFLVLASNGQSKYDIEQKKVHDLEDAKKEAEKLLPYDNVVVMNFESDAALRQKEEDKHVSLLYGKKFVDWFFIGIEPASCKGYKCSKININLKDGSKKIILFKGEIKNISYDDAIIINADGGELASRKKEEYAQIGLKYGVENVDWKLQSEKNIECNVAGSYWCEQIIILLKDGSIKSMIFKVNDPLINN